jgi:hypothetical protein
MVCSAVAAQVACVCISFVCQARREWSSAASERCSSAYGMAFWRCCCACPHPLSSCMPHYVCGKLGAHLAAAATHRLQALLQGWGLVYSDMYLHTGLTSQHVAWYRCNCVAELPLTISLPRHVPVQPNCPSCQMMPRPLHQALAVSALSSVSEISSDGMTLASKALRW